MKKAWLWVTAGLLFFSLLASGLYVGRLLSYDRVYPGVTLEGIDMSNRTRDEVVQIVGVWQKSQREKVVTVSYKNNTFKVEAQQLDVDFDGAQAVEAVWDYGRAGSWWERLQKIRQAASVSYNVPLKIKYDENKVSALVDYWREMVDKPPRNAALSMTTGGVVPHEEGQRLDVDALRPALVKAFTAGEESKLPLPVVAMYPEITVDDILKTGIREMVSVYSTYFNNQDINRTANIKRAANNINGYILYPGNTFSFNEVVGPREIVNGFKEALEIVNGEFVPGIGGGVCQVSSTLYNAAILADLKVVDRTNHSKPLSYVPLGRDATVVYGALDFKFKNNTEMPLMILADVQGNKLMVGLFGQHRLEKQVDIFTVDQQVIPPPVVKKQDPALLAGESKVEKEGAPGYGVTTVRVVSAQGKEIKREILSKDRYMPDTTVVKVGSELPAVVENKGEPVKLLP